jgi:DNA-binding XRE family transcriptional regulator
MKNKLIYTFDEHLQESLKNSEFRKAWEESEAEYVLATKLIEARLARKLSQRDLAQKVSHARKSFVVSLKKNSKCPGCQTTREFFIKKRYTKRVVCQITLLKVGISQKRQQQNIRQSLTYQRTSEPANQRTSSNTPICS